MDFLAMLIGPISSVSENILARTFLTNQRGNIAALFAIASLPVLGGVTMAIEYSSLSNHKTKLQNAVDAAALFAGKHYFRHNNLPGNAEVEDFFRVNFTGNVKAVTVKLIDNKVVTSAHATAPALFYGKILPEVFEQGAEAAVPVGQKSNIDIAMVLDTTRSMASDGKLASLKTVAKSFVDNMSKEANANTKIKMGIVPFSNHVNVGMSNRNASWIDVPDDKVETKEVCRHSWPAGTSMTCSDETRYADGIPYQANVCVPNDQSVQTIETCRTETTETKWFGCVGSRKDPYMITDGSYVTRMPGVTEANNWHCPSALTPLTDQISDLKQSISNLVDRGDTYIAPGVMWGLRLLSKHEPFTQGTDPSSLPAGTQLRKIMIVMTDGDNSRSSNQPWDAANWGSNTANANDVTRQACATARDQDVTVFSIAFGTTISDDGKSVMQDCAGDASRYFPAADADALDKAFDAIGSQIFSLRISS